MSRRGRVLFFSRKRFVEEIAYGECCFICGAARGTKPFNGEHVIPDWLLRRHKLHRNRIALPNLTPFTYGGYRVPCCVQCNSTMSKTFENVIAPAFERGFDGLLKYLKRRGAKHFFKWLSLIFLKTHLKDRLLVADRSSRDPTPSKIGDMYDWDSLHHVHCVARSFHSRAQIRDEVVGTILIFRVEAHESYFDFADSYEGRTLLLCSKDIGIIAVLNDSGAVHTLMKPRLDAFEPPFSDVQARELFVVAAYCNQLVVDRPRYLTEVDLQTGQSEILAALPKESALNEWIPAEFGGMFAYYLKDMLPRIQHEDGLDMGELVRSGEFSFLFDRQGNFTPPEQLFVEQHDDPAKATHSEPQSDPAAAGKRSRGA